MRKMKVTQSRIVELDPENYRNHSGGEETTDTYILGWTKANEGANPTPVLSYTPPTPEQMVAMETEHSTEDPGTFAEIFEHEDTTVTIELMPEEAEGERADG